MPVINKRQFKNVKLFWLDFKDVDRYGKYSVTIGGLSDDDCEFFKGTKKTIKEDPKYGKFVRFAIKPERLESLVYVDAKNRPLSLDTKPGNGSIANVVVANFQNSMGIYPMLNGIQVVEMKEYGAGGRDNMFEPVEAFDMLDSPFGDVDG